MSALVRAPARFVPAAARRVGDLARPLRDPARRRRLLVVLALAVAGLSLLATVLATGADPIAPPLVIAVASPVAVIVALAAPRHRHLVYTGAAAVAGVLTPEVGEVSLAVAGFMFLAVLEVPDRRQWIPWGAGLAGAAAGLVVTSLGGSPEMTPAAFVTAAIGGGLGLLERASARSEALQEETHQWRRRSRDSEKQATWLEQRTTLARELHDVVGHHVTAMVVQAEAGLVRDHRAALTQIGTLGRQALSELDAMVVHLRDPDATITRSAPPRLADIDEILAATLRQQGVDVAVKIDEDAGLDEVGVLTVYRIAQEALTNVSRHAQATSAAVEVRRLEGHVRLRVTDDGVGPPVTVDRGSGLLGIQERVAARGGVWEMGERLGGGTIIDVLLPVPEA